MNKQKLFLFFFLSVSLFFLFARRCIAATQVTKVPIQGDTYISSGRLYSNYFLEPNLFAGYISENNIQKTRSFLKFDISNHELTEDNLQKVTLNLFQNKEYGVSPFTILLMEPENTWIETLITWSNQPSSVTVGRYENISPDYGWKSFDITAIFKRWIRYSINEPSLMVRLSPDTDPSVSFWSIDCTDFLGVNRCPNSEKPYIEITHFVNSAPTPGKNMFPPSNSVFSTLQLPLSIEGTYDEENDPITYTLEISQSNFINTLEKTGPQDSNTFTYDFKEFGEYQWRILVQDSFNSAYSEINDITLKKEEEIISEHQEENQTEDTIDSEEETQIDEITPLSVDEIPEANDIDDENIAVIDEPRKEEGSILGLSSEQCIIKYYSDTKKFDLASCKANSPSATKVASIKISDSQYLTEIKGKVENKRKLTYYFYRCKNKTLLDPRTYFMCVYEKYKEITTDAIIKNYLEPIVSQKVTVTSRTIDKNGYYKTGWISTSNPSLKTIKMITKQTISDTATGTRFTFTLISSPSNQLTIPSVKSSGNLLSNFFSKIIGVTQWYGKTAYSTFHTGIDFGATKEKIYSPEAGTVTQVGWDSYYGKCLSGGNILRIQHTNGIHSVYYHLNGYANGIKVGSKVNKGQYIAVSGNSGAFNCQPLAHHLHFETRKSANAASHVNPVPQLNINWTNVPTLNYQKYPGRLTGQNPHPKY